MTNDNGGATQPLVKTGFKHATTKNAMSKHKEWVRKFDDLQISSRVMDQQEEVSVQCSARHPSPPPQLPALRSDVVE